MSFLHDLFGLRGFISEPHDANDQEYEPRKDIKIKDGVDLREEYPGFWLPIYDQLKYNSCVANAAAALHYFEYTKERSAHETQMPPAIHPSRVFIWYNARLADPKTNKHNLANRGCYTRNAMKTLSNSGVRSELLCRYPSLNALEEADKQPTDQAYEDAKQYRIARYQRLDSNRSKEQKKNWQSRDFEKQKDDEGSRLRQKLRAALSEGHPVQFGFYYYETDHEKQFLGSDGTMRELARLPGQKHEPPPPKLGSHAVLAVGYNKEHVICRSSWGSGFSEKGFFRMPWEWITDFEATDDFWIITAFESEESAEGKGSTEAV